MKYSNPKIPEGINTSHENPVKSLSKGVVVASLLALIGGQNSADISGFISSGSQMVFLNYSREQEQDADNEAVQLSANMYRHTQGAQQLFDVLYEQSIESNTQSISWLNSHPDVEQRIKSAELLAFSNQWQLSGELVAIPNEIVALMHDDKLLHDDN